MIYYIIHPRSLTHGQQLSNENCYHKIKIDHKSNLASIPFLDFYHQRAFAKGDFTRDGILPEKRFDQGGAFSWILPQHSAQ